MVTARAVAEVAAEAVAKVATATAAEAEAEAEAEAAVCCGGEGGVDGSGLWRRRT